MNEWENEPDVKTFDLPKKTYMQAKIHKRRRINDKWRKRYGTSLTEISMHVIIYRHDLKHLCGYVGIPKGHDFYGVECWGNSPVRHIQVHGGLTFSSGSLIKSPFKGGLWYFGFDAAHYMDYVPGMDQILRRAGVTVPLLGDVYRNMAYMEQECRDLAEQLSWGDQHERMVLLRREVG